MGMNETVAASDEQKRKVLEAMARAGEAGVADYQHGQEQNAANQKAALSSAAQTAALLQVGTTGAGQLAGMVAEPGNLAGQYLAAGQDRFARDIARQDASNASYFTQAAAAVPAIKASADREVGIMKARWEEARRKEAAAASAKEADLAKWKIEALATGAAEDARNRDLSNADSMRASLLKERDALTRMEVQAQRDLRPTVAAGPRVMGAQPVRPVPASPEAQARLDEIKARRDALDRQIAELSGVDPAKTGAGGITRRMMGGGMFGGAVRGVDNAPGGPSSVARSRLASATPEQLVPPLHVYQRQAAVQGGLTNEAMAGGLFRPPTPTQELSRFTAEQSLNNLSTLGAKTPQAAVAAERAADPATFALAAKAGINPQEVQAIKGSNAYKKMKADADLAAQGAQSIDDLRALLNATYRRSPKAIRLILAEYGPRLVGSGYIPGG